MSVLLYWKAVRDQTEILNKRCGAAQRDLTHPLIELSAAQHRLARFLTGPVICVMSGKPVLMRPPRPPHNSDDEIIGSLSPPLSHLVLFSAALFLFFPFFFCSFAQSEFAAEPFDYLRLRSAVRTVPLHDELDGPYWWDRPCLSDPPRPHHLHRSTGGVPLPLLWGHCQTIHPALCGAQRWTFSQSPFISALYFFFLVYFFSSFFSFLSHCNVPALAHTQKKW